MSDAVSSVIYGSRSAGTSAAQNTVQIPTEIFSRAVVIHTLCDPSDRDPEKDKNIISTLRNPADFMRAPRNAVVCRLISDGKGRVLNEDYVCFPFFSSHLMMPIKAGEQVWLFFEQIGSQNSRPFWISRIAEPLHVEDANFTHGDRRTQREFSGLKVENKPQDDGSGNFDDPRKLKFQNGNVSSPDQATLLGDQSAFIKLITESKEYDMTVIEPVPRLTKRPGDLVLQGSNNTSIALGTMMGWDYEKRPGISSNSIAKTDKIQPQSGAIDIVAGRGKYFQAPSTEKSSPGKKSGKSPDKSTRPYIEETVIPGVFETDKNVATIQDEVTAKSKGNNRTNPQEGDPDFLMDASRVFLSNISDIDKALNTGSKGVAKPFQGEIIDMRGATVAVKSDHVRIVARKSGAQGSPDDISNENPPTNGTIRIVKEGNPNSDLASITIESDGSIHISGSKIFIGRKKEDGGEGTGPGPGESQPYVKYKQLEDLLTKTFDDLSNFVQKLQANFSANTTPGFGAPNPALIKSAADECTEFLSNISIRKNEIATLKSKRIFGE